MTTYLYDIRGGAAAPSPRSRWTRAESAGELVDQAVIERGDADRPFAERRSGGFLHDRLSAGDTLVIPGLGSLGRDYAAILAAAGALMRRRVVLRAIDENLTFDGTIEEPGKQATRDALIAFAAAAADARRQARAAAQARSQALADDGDELERQTKRHAAVMQFGVVAAQIAVMALVAYFLSFALPSRQSHGVAAPPPQRLQVAFIDRPLTAAPTEILSDAPQRSVEVPRKSSFGGLSAEEEREVYAQVGKWRSARLDNPAFPVSVGAIVPPGVRLAVFPKSLLARKPVLRGLSFIVVNERLAVVEPGTRQIVAMWSG